MRAGSQGDIFTYLFLIYSSNKWFLRLNLCLILCLQEESLIGKTDPGGTVQSKFTVTCALMEVAQGIMYFQRRPLFHLWGWYVRRSKKPSLDK